jgi:hypothetical protein
MGASARWYSDGKTTGLIELHSPLMWEEFHNAVHSTHALIHEVQHTVNIIIHPHGKLPDGNPLVHFRDAFKMSAK